MYVYIHRYVCIYMAKRKQLEVTDERGKCTRTTTVFYQPLDVAEVSAQGPLQPHTAAEITHLYMEWQC